MVYYWQLSECLIGCCKFINIIKELFLCFCSCCVWLMMLHERIFPPYCACGCFNFHINLQLNYLSCLSFSTLLIHFGWLQTKLLTLGQNLTSWEKWPQKLFFCIIIHDILLSLFCQSSPPRELVCITFVGLGQVVHWFLGRTQNWFVYLKINVRARLDPLNVILELAE